MDMTLDDKVFAQDLSQMRRGVITSVDQFALHARSTHDVHHAIVGVNAVIGVVLGELHVVVRVHIPLVVVCDEAVVRRTLGLIALVVIVVFVVAIFHKNFAVWEIFSLHDSESDWTEDWQDDWYWHDSEDCASEWYDNESAYLVCGIAGSNPSLNQQSKDKVKLMIDSGSQSTACNVDFAKGYATDVTERAELWDIQDQKIEAHGKKIVDVKFHGQANETPVPARIMVDVSDVARNVALMGRLLRAGFDLHFTNHGHRCCMESGGLRTTISEDSPTSEAPL